MSILPVSPVSLAHAADILRRGGVVAYPTETVYGLAADPLNPEALEKLFAIKGRPDTNPVLLIVANREQLDPFVTTLSDAALHCMETFWPGPLSLVLPAREGLPAAIAPQGRVCVRCPGLESARDLCAAYGGAVTSTSANLSGQPAAIDATAANLPGVDLTLDGGALSPAPPSTVYDPDSRTVFREGAIARDRLLP